MVCCTRYSWRRWSCSDNAVLIRLLRCKCPISPTGLFGRAFQPSFWVPMAPGVGLCKFWERLCTANFVRGIDCDTLKVDWASGCENNKITIQIWIRNQQIGRMLSSELKLRVAVRDIEVCAFQDTWEVLGIPWACFKAWTCKLRRLWQVESGTLCNSFLCVVVNKRPKLSKNALPREPECPSWSLV